MQYKIITVNLPHGGSTATADTAPADTAPADTARQVEHLRAENRILRRLAVVCTVTLLAELTLFSWQLHTTRETYDVLKASCEFRAAAAEQRARDYRALLDTYEAAQ